MPFNINAFKSEGLKYGGVRPSLFRVEFTPPPIGGVTFQNQAMKKATFTCRAAEIPDATIASIEVPYFGRKIKVAGERTFGDWSVTFMNDEDFTVRAMFETWNNAINTLVSNVRLPGASTEEYKTDLQVYQYGKDGQILRSYNFVGAFPTVVSNIALGWDTQNAIEEFSVNFAYDYWVPEIEFNTKQNGTGAQMTYLADALTDGPSGPA